MSSRRLLALLVAAALVSAGSAPIGAQADNTAERPWDNTAE